jgi:hypothetical protein
VGVTAGARGAAGTSEGTPAVKRCSHGMTEQMQAGMARGYVTVVGNKMAVNPCRDGTQASEDARLALGHVLSSSDGGGVFEKHNRRVRQALIRMLYFPVDHGRQQLPANMTDETVSVTLLLLFAAPKALA